jgi:hypothetical protein
MPDDYVNNSLHVGYGSYMTGFSHWIWTGFVDAHCTLPIVLNFSI